MNKILRECAVWTCGFTFKCVRQTCKHLWLRNYPLMKFRGSVLGSELFTRPFLPLPFLTPPTRKGLGTKLPPPHLLLKLWPVCLHLMFPTVGDTGGEPQFYSNHHVSVCLNTLQTEVLIHVTQMVQLSPRRCTRSIGLGRLCSSFFYSINFTRSQMCCMYQYNRGTIQNRKSLIRTC